MSGPRKPVIHSHQLPATAPDSAFRERQAGRVRVALAGLCGCWGCTLSLLDGDERLLDLLQRITLVRGSFTDLKRIDGRCRIGLVEGGVANEENIETLAHFRRHCDILVAVGACAIWGGVPSLRNPVGRDACLEEAYLRSPTRPPEQAPLVPAWPGLPRLTDRVYPCHEVVRMDYFVPGCPPDGATVVRVLEALLAGREPELPAAAIRYD